MLNFVKIMPLQLYFYLVSLFYSLNKSAYSNFFPITLKSNSTKLILNLLDFFWKNLTIQHVYFQTFGIDVVK